MANQLAELIGLTYKFQTMIRDPGWIADLEKHQQLLKNSGYGDAARDAALLEQQFRELGDRWDSVKKRFAVRVFEPLLQDLEGLGKWLDAHGPEIDAWIEGFAHTIDTAVKIVVPLLSKVAEGWGYIFDGIKKVGDYINNAFPNVSESLGKGFGWLIDKLGIKGIVDQELGLRPPGSPPLPSTVRNAPMGVRFNNPGNLEYRGQAGAVRGGGTPEERRFAAFRTPQEGLDAMARQLELGFGRGQKTIESLVERYAPPEENDTAAYINDVARQMHVSSRAGLNLSDPAVLTSLMNSMIAHEQGQNIYRPQDVRAAAEGAIKGGSVNLTQNNNYNITGGDPAQTKKQIQDALYDSNRRLTRNLQPATQ
jgi:hypothetical protein